MVSSTKSLVCLGAVLSLAAGCASLSDGTEASSSDSTIDRFDIPLAGATAEQVATFNDGDEEFDVVRRDADGLGPLYTQQSCGACHASATRGPGSVQKMVVVMGDGYTPNPDQSPLSYGNTVHPLTAGGGHTPVTVPANDPHVKVSLRIGPPTLGRGYMEAVLDSEIERMAAAQAQRTDGIHGRVNHLPYGSEANTATTFPTHAKGDIVIGRFGLKARVPTLDDFTADALQGDMGITSPMRPVEIPNPDGLTDDMKPGIDLSIDNVNKIANYMRLIAIPRRTANDAGAAAFAAAKCDVCHAPSLKTRADWPIAAVANIDAAVFTDFLLHDMGTDLADGMAFEGQAGPRDWRTAPLIGLRFLRSYLHDGRAATVADAIEAHAGPGSEAAVSVDAFHALDATAQSALLAYVNSL
jgi:CxxC motif-containing protein (DUF1111 family)